LIHHILLIDYVKLELNQDSKMALLARALVQQSTLSKSRGSNILNTIFPRRTLRQSNVIFSSAQSNEHGEQDRIFTVPNLLCVGRIAVSPYLASSIINGDLKTSLAIFGFAGFTDLMDGWIARKVPGQASKLGSFLDPLADKILVMTLYLSLSTASLMPASLTALIISRDVLLVYAGMYIRYMSVKPPFTWEKYFDARLPTAQVNPTTISKINTGFQFLTIAAALCCPIIGYKDHHLFFTLCGITATTTFASALSYAFQRNTYTFQHMAYDHQTAKKLTALAIFILFNIGFAAHEFDLWSKFVENKGD